MYWRNNLPLNFYYQLNGKTAQENYRDYKNRQSQKFFDELMIKRGMKQELTPIIENTLTDIISQIAGDKNINIDI